MRYACGCEGTDTYQWTHLRVNAACEERAYAEWNWHLWLGRAFRWWAMLNASNGRTMLCDYGGNEQPSDPKAAFFKSVPDGKHDRYYCGCYGWD